MQTDKDDNNFIYDIAFSFAGEQREYVSKVYQILKDGYDVKVFYDENAEIKANLWGKDLVDEFQKIYCEQSKFCLIFISEDYKQKVWTKHEKRSALARAINEREEYILPARFDATEIPGILPTTHYINISNMTPDDFSEIVLIKLGIPLKQKDTFTDSKIQPNTSKHRNKINPRMLIHESSWEIEEKLAKERESIKKSIEKDFETKVRMAFLGGGG